MSLFSLVNLVLLFFILPCIFFFHPFILVLILCLWFYLFNRYVSWEFVNITTDRIVGFWLFLVSEVIVFATLLFTCLWFQDYYSKPIAYAYGAPMVESWLLISSSFFMTSYRGLINTKWCHLFLNWSIIFSFFFMITAVLEVISSGVSSLFNPHAAACYMTIGLHFIHVVIGTVGLTQLDYYFSFDVVRRYSWMIVVYWHFVDYVWLVVFTIVYLLV
uniref:Cytochrome c oxidase subunit III n=1 Tax=Schistosoma japonicum TaxID=6182 RepID=A0A0U3UD02_SCHJA|nr:cytochrome c oxidase subunit III [Schistosoma japonicum]